MARILALDTGVVGAIVAVLQPRVLAQQQLSRA
jgi:hypothetical protein